MLARDDKEEQRELGKKIQRLRGDYEGMKRTCSGYFKRTSNLLHYGIKIGNWYPSYKFTGKPTRHKISDEVSGGGDGGCAV